MINLANTENALKTIYLEVMTEILNRKVNPFLTKVEQTTSDVWGKEIRRCVTYNDEYVNLISELKNLYQTIAIPERLISMFANMGMRMFDVLNDEFESLLKKAQFEMSKMLYSPNKTSKDITGIADIFDMSKSLYSVDRSHPLMQPLIKDVSKLTDVAIESVIDELCERGSDIDFIAVSKDVKYAYMERHKNIDIVDLGGFKALSHNGIPMVMDFNIPKRTMYLLSTKSFKLHQLCAWRWLETENGRILQQRDKEGVYKATMVKYCDLMCDRPDRQGMIRIGG